MQKLTSDAYSFTVTQESDMIVTVLKQTASGKEKRFTQVWGCVENLTKHMNSLTDVQCNDWFEDKRKKKPKAS